METSTNIAPIFELDKPILDVIFAFLVPTEYISCSLVCKLFHERLTNRFFVYVMYGKWVHELSVSKLMHEIPYLTYRDLIKDVMLILPTQLSKSVYNNNILCLNAMRAGYSEEECMTYLDIASVFKLLDIAILANSLGYKKILASLLLSMSSDAEILADRFLSSDPANNELLVGSDFSWEDARSLIERIPTECDLSVSEYLEIIMSCMEVADHGVYYDFLNGIFSKSFNPDTYSSMRKAGFMIAQYMPREELDLVMKKQEMLVELPDTRIDYEFCNSIAARTWIEVKTPNGTDEFLYETILLKYRPDLYITKKTTILHKHNLTSGISRRYPYYLRKLSQ